MKKYIILFGIIFLIITTSIVKSSTRQLEKNIFILEEEVKILEEKYDRIVFGYKSMAENQVVKQVFYKKTKIYKWHAATTSSLMIVYNCQKMN